MNYEFRLVPHLALPGIQVVEVWREGKFVACIYPHQDGIRVVSKFMTDMSWETEPAMSLGEWIPSAIIKLGEKPVL